MYRKYWFLIILMVVLLDQGTKQLVLRYEDFLPMTVTQFLDIVLVWNKGISFGLLNNSNFADYLIYINSAILAIILWWLCQPSQKDLRVQTAFILGGGVSNIIDRLLYDGVVDFICLHWNAYYWPSFNLADSSITLAVIYILWHFMKANTAKDFK